MKTSIPESLNQEHNQKNLIDVPVAPHRYELEKYLLKGYKSNVSLAKNASLSRFI